jgi:hypothetical protein
MSDLEAEKGVAVAALIVAIGVGLIMNHWVEDMWLCIGVGMLTFIASGIGLKRYERLLLEKIREIK